LNLLISIIHAKVWILTNLVKWQVPYAWQMRTNGLLRIILP